MPWLPRATAFVLVIQTVLICGLSYAYFTKSPAASADKGLSDRHRLEVLEKRMAQLHIEPKIIADMATTDMATVDMATVDMATVDMATVDWGSLFVQLAKAVTELEKRLKLLEDQLSILSKQQKEIVQQGEQSTLKINNLRNEIVINNEKFDLKVGKVTHDLYEQKNMLGKLENLIITILSLVQKR